MRLPRNRFVRWIALPSLSCLAIFAVNFFYTRNAAFRDSREAYAAITKHLDETEPGWRWEDVLAARRAVPNEENCYLLQKEIWDLYLQKRDLKIVDDAGGKDMSRQLIDHAPELGKYREMPAPMPPEIAEWAGDYVEGHRDAIAIARRMADRPMGRHPIEYQQPLINTQLPTVQETRVYAVLLMWDCRVQSQLGHFDSALRDIRAIRNAARSTGDDAFLISCLVRNAVDQNAVEALREMLASGEAPANGLAVLQREFLEESREKILERSLRFERALLLNMLQYYAERVYEMAGKKSPEIGDRIGQFIYAAYAHGDQAASLREFDSALEIARSPTEDIKPRMEQWTTEFRLKARNEIAKQGKNHIMTYLLMPAIDKVAIAYLRWLAHLRTAVVGIACERFRLAKGHWPESTDKLIPGFLDEKLLDPFTGQPLLYRKLADGIAVYSVGEDGKDDAGDVLFRIDRDHLDLPIEIQILKKPADIGIRLWNPELRGRTPEQPK